MPDWFDNHRMISVGIFLLIVFILILGFLYLKADEITKDPCSICAEYQGQEVTCVLPGFKPISKIYYPDGQITPG